MTTTPTPASQPPALDRTDYSTRVVQTNTAAIPEPSPARSDTTAERVAYVADVASRENPKLDALKAKYPARSDKDADDPFNALGNCKRCGGKFGHSRMCPHFTEEMASAPDWPLLAAKAQESAPSSDSIDTPEFRERVRKCSTTWDTYEWDTHLGDLIAYIDARRATASNAAPTDELRAVLIELTATQRKLIDANAEIATMRLLATPAATAAPGNAEILRAALLAAREMVGHPDNVAIIDKALADAATAAPGDLPPLPAALCRDDTRHDEDYFHADTVREIQREAYEYGRACLASNAGAAPAITDGWKRALHAAVAALYFDDSSDFRWSLGAVVRHLDADLAGELMGSPKAAYDKACAMLDAAPSNPPVGAKENKHA